MGGNNKKASSREALLRSAEELFAERSFAAVSTRELADRAGVNLGAIQYHFGSKTQLFVEAIRGAMSRNIEEASYFPNETTLTSREQAAEELCRFVHKLTYNMCHPKGPDVRRMMHREILGATSQNEELREVLVSSVVEDIFRPFDERVKSIVRILLSDEPESKLHYILQSIYGQCLYYASDRAYVERLRGEDHASEPHLTAVCRHIASFTLRGIGLDEKEINQALRGAEQSLKEK